MFCVNACSNAYQDDKRATCNTLLRVKTPYPKRENCEELFSKIVGCVCFPFKCLEGCGMMLCGAFLWPIPCTVCRISTEHVGTHVSVKGCCFDTRMTNHPCYFKDTYIRPTPTGWNQTESDGCDAFCNLCEVHYEGSIEQVSAGSSVTGFGCIWAGCHKVLHTVFNMACCPFQCCCVTANACCDCCCPTPPTR